MPTPIAPLAWPAPWRTLLRMQAASRHGLNWLNFLVAAMQTGFGGAFLSAYLGSQGWSLTEIGLVLSASTVATMLAQVPGGLLVDAAPSKRVAAAAAVLATAIAALVVAALPTFNTVLAAEVVQGLAAAVLMPAIAAITLVLTHQDELGERFGHNVRFAAIGNAGAALVMGVAGSSVSSNATLLIAGLAGSGALAALVVIRGTDIARAHEHTTHVAAAPAHVRKGRELPTLHVASDRDLLIFASCMALFTLGNAAILPLAAATAARRGLPATDLFLALAIAVPQLIAAALSPRFGRLAHQHGRRLVLLLGFAAMPLRALLFAIDGGSVVFVIYQALDGISAAAFGVMVPLVAADVTHNKGRFNLAMGIVGLFVGLGGALSTALAGGFADRFGNVDSFLVLAGFGLAATTLMWFAMPETRHHPAAAGAPPPASG
jgi:MFS family permease